MAGESPARRAREKSAQLRKDEEEKARRKRALIQIGVIVALVVVVIGGTIAVLSSNDGDDVDPPTGTVVAPSAANENGGIYAGDTSGVSGVVDVTLIEDFQCPACRAFEEKTGDLLAEYAAADSGVRLEYRPIAFLDGQSSTEYSSRAANAAFCVAGEDAAYFLPFHNFLFENQPEEGGDGLPDSKLVEYAVKAGASEATVSTCIADRGYDGWIQQQTAKTLKEIEGTPTVLVNGDVLENPTPARLADAVKEAK